MSTISTRRTQERRRIANAIRKAVDMGYYCPAQPFMCNAVFELLGTGDTDSEFKAFWRDLGLDRTCLVTVLRDNDILERDHNWREDFQVTEAFWLAVLEMLEANLCTDISKLRECGLMAARTRKEALP